MSATLDVGPLREYLKPCELLSSEGRTFPVDIEHLDKTLGDWPVWEAAVKELEQLVTQHDGDALVFMPGAYEISRTVRGAQDALGIAHDACVNFQAGGTGEQGFVRLPVAHLALQAGLVAQRDIRRVRNNQIHGPIREGR